MSKILLPRPLQTAIRFVLISALTFSLALGWALLGWILSAHGQLPTASSTDPLKPPAGVTRWGEYETAPVQSTLDGKELFTLTSPTVFNRNNVPEGKIPVEIRAEEVNQRLLRVFIRITAAKQTPTVAIATLNNRPVLQISDDQSSRPIRSITVKLSKTWLRNGKRFFKRRWLDSSSRLHQRCCLNNWDRHLKSCWGCSLPVWSSGYYDDCCRIDNKLWRACINEN